VVSANKGKEILFIVDGTDRLTKEDSDSFFLDNIHQLQQLQANFIYCAPVSVLLAGPTGQNFDAVFKLPMVKLSEKGERQRNEIAWQSLRDLVAKRIPLEAFSDTTVVDSLVAASGGHPRDLLRLVNLCFQETDSAPINSSIASTAIRRLANDYSRLLSPEDYGFLYSMDNAPKNETVVTDQSRRLLFDLCLLEYNDYWWQSHPVIQTLPAYQKSVE
jgi:hypothetical protein